VPIFLSWKHIFDKWREFAIEAWNIKLGLALDGVNPFGNLSFYHFTWLVVLFNYNSPPWLVMKCSFLMLALIIHGKEFLTSGNVDVCLEILIEELHILWKGVSTFDAHQGVTFSLKGNVHVEHARLSNIWVIYRMCDQGLVGCPPCGPSTESWSSRKLKKVVYYGSCCYLPRNHPYQRA
jgi:hypothetical protein